VNPAGTATQQKRTEALLNLYVAGVFAAAVLFAVPAIASAEIGSLNPQVLAGFLIWLLLAIGADLLSITLPRGQASQSVGGAIDFGIVLLFPTGLTAIAGFTVGLITNAARRTDFRRIVFNSSMLCLTMLLTSTLIQEMGTKVSSLQVDQISGWPLGRMIPSYLVAAVAYFLVNTGLTSVAIAISTNSQVINVWTTNYVWTTIGSLANAPLGFIVAIVYHVLSESIVLASIGLLIFVLPVLVLHTSYRWFNNLNSTYFSSIRALVSALDASHHYTQGHSRRVSQNAVAVARRLRLPARETEAIERGAILHDIGKIGMDNSVLDKEGPLSSLEWVQMKQHTVLGFRIVRDLTFLRDAKDIILHHHERVDGKGYPSGLHGADIPVGARVVNAVDALDALTSNRSYRPALTPDQAIAILEQNAGSQFDADVVGAVQQLYMEGRLIFQADSSPEEDEILFTMQDIQEAVSLV